MFEEITDLDRAVSEAKVYKVLGTLTDELIEDISNDHMVDKWVLRAALKL